MLTLRALLVSMLCHAVAVVVPAHVSPAVAAEPAFDARLADYPYPFAVETFRLSSQKQALEMAYMHLPARAGQPTALLLHGKNFNAAYWKATADFLHARGWGVVMPDQIGFGKSSKPTSYQYSFYQLTANTRSLVDSLGLKRVVVVGHSMGGMLAARFALDHPDIAARLVMINPIGLEDYLEYTRYPTIDQSYARELALTAEAINGYQRKHYYDGNWSDTYEALTVPLRGWLNGPDREQIAYVSALTYDMILTEPVVGDFPRLEVPSVLILGTRDRSAPNAANMRPGVTRELGRYDRLGHEVVKQSPAMKLIELDGLGHMPQVEHFTRYAQALRAALELGD